MSSPPSYESMLFGKRFRFGSESRSISDFLDIQTIAKIQEKVKIDNVQEMYLLLRELIRYLYLVSVSNHQLFFPGCKKMDAIWHALILETEKYQKFCDRIAKGKFFHHSGILYVDYISQQSRLECHGERLNWMTSYIFNFGAMEPESLEVLPRASELMQSVGGNLNRLNSFFFNMIKCNSTFCAGSATEDPLDFDRLISESIAPMATALAEDYDLLKEQIPKVFSALRARNQGGVLLMSNDELEATFFASTALAFTIWQHMNAVDRLRYHQSWQLRRKEVWSAIAGGHQFCGLATTHLAKPGDRPLQSTKVDQDFLLNGVVGWVSGYRIFDYLLLGFANADQYVFAVIDFPEESTDLEIIKYDLASVNSTSSVQISFRDFKVMGHSVVYSRPIDSESNNPLVRFVAPDLGIGKRALSEIARVLEIKDHPRNSLIKDKEISLRNELREIKVSRFDSNHLTDVLLKKDIFNRRCVNLLCIAKGATGLQRNDIAARLQLDILLTDAVIQSPDLIKKKIEAL